MDGTTSNRGTWVYRVLSILSSLSSRASRSRELRFCNLQSRGTSSFEYGIWHGNGSKSCCDLPASEAFMQVYIGSTTVYNFGSLWNSKQVYTCTHAMQDEVQYDRVFEVIIVHAGAIYVRERKKSYVMSWGRTSSHVDAMVQEIISCAFGGLGRSIRAAEA